MCLDFISIMEDMKEPTWICSSKLTQRKFFFPLFYPPCIHFFDSFPVKNRSECSDNYLKLRD